MYVMADSTYGTMADLLRFKGFLNSTAPLNPLEYQPVWKGDERYFDFLPGDEYKQECQYPTFYTEEGRPVQNGSDSFFDELKGCYDSEFDLYGAMDSIDLAPDWKKSLAKAGLVQDRLRDWVPSTLTRFVLTKQVKLASMRLQVLLERFANQLIRIDFFGRGREPEMRPQNQTQAISLTNTSDDQYFLRLLGLDGNYTAPGDTSIDFVDAWNDILISNDLININTVGLDHRDPTHPVRNVIKSFYHLRENVPSLKDGFYLESLSKSTHNVTLPGSNGTITELGLWSAIRDQYPGINDLAPTNESAVWLVYHNENSSVEYDFDCSSPFNGFLAPFSGGVKVRNLLAPYDEIYFQAFDFRAYIPSSQWICPPVVMTEFLPGYDARIESNTTINEGESIDLELRFSEKLDCDTVTKSILIASKTQSEKVPRINIDSVSCAMFRAESMKHPGQIPSTWSWKATVDNVTHGIHTMTVNNASTATKSRFTNSIDHWMFRVGSTDNPIVFPMLANYTETGLTELTDAHGFLVEHTAAGADKWRFSTNWGSSWSPWEVYEGTPSRISNLPWSGTKRQQWEGSHVILQYWSKMAGSSQHVQHMDLRGANKSPRRFPHLFAIGDLNKYGQDVGLKNTFSLDDKIKAWKFHLSAEWPSKLQVNVWGINPDKKLDQTFLLGNTLNSSRLNRLQPDSLSVGDNVVDFSEFPPAPYMAYQMELNDGNMRFELVSVGQRLHQQIMYLLLWILPVVTGALSVWIYMGAFYHITFNRTGVEVGKINAPGVLPLAAISIPKPKRTVLLATLIYDIEDWSIKIKIGGLGVMAQLMGKNLPHHDIVWVVPCVGGVDYPIDIPADPMSIAIAGTVYEVQVQYHKLRNVTYVLLDAPIFRQQTKSEPYPPRMDDLRSAIYYSAWNNCIAETAKPPLYLLPRTIPCCLSLHNAEFQGLWPLRDEKELDEISEVFNLKIQVIRKYVQFGEVFNLLHAGASYLRVHQRGFGAVEIGKLPNPDPSDTEPWDPEAESRQVIQVDPEYDDSRGNDRWQAQKWAGLKVDPIAELFVFVGRWSVQKGVDLIADIFPVILGKHSNVQLICVGPVIDMHGKFAALKLQEMMTLYPGRVFSKPEFTALPPFIFTGAEFALIPSRDEPLVSWRLNSGGKELSESGLWLQFKAAIESAIGSKQSNRAMMRANSAKQRFPVARWVEDLDYLQLRSIRMHEEQNDPSRMKPRGSSRSGGMHSRYFSQTSLVMMQTPSLNIDEMNPIPRSSGSEFPAGTPTRSLSLGVRSGPGHQPKTTVLHEGTALTPRLEEIADPDEQAMSTEEAEAILSRGASDNAEQNRRGRSMSGVSSSSAGMTGLGISQAYSPAQRGRLRSTSVLSLHQIRATRESFSLENADPTFKDETGRYSRYFQDDDEGNESNWEDASAQEMLLPVSIQRPPAIQRWLSIRIVDWPIYSMLLALGQMMAANSSHITLLTGSESSPAALYILGSLYIITSCGWWLAFRRIPSLYILSLPFVLYSLAFFIIGVASFSPDASGQTWAYHIAAAFYIMGSSSGYLFFSLNFGDDGGSKIESWIYRACLIQGRQNIYVAALFFWGSELASRSRRGAFASPGVAAGITIPIAALLLTIAAALYTGLPKYYRQSPGKIPAFYKSIFRRKIIIWFSISVVLQNYFLSMPYQRNWAYLWGSTYAPGWMVLLLALTFFIGVWYVLLALLAWRSKTHSWILPIFAAGLGAPRWAQMLWGTSGIGLWVPWIVGGPRGSALGGRILWLWLGVLDSIQGVGFGMMLLQTLTRIHIAATLCGAQLIGTVTTLVASASAPDRDRECIP
ncbi:hypothetical protein N7507_010028 [Penicillium longicatenatum]|nr:hypothetical protein N7507_010028 [Penicillium longicatenatum]